jgi:uncharacterized protein (DUF362 family)
MKEKGSDIRVFPGSDKEVCIGHCPESVDIVLFVGGMLEEKMPDLPRDARILVKPNFHKDVPSVASNTTDFRLIIAVIRALQKRGYHNITIGEGPACGFDYTNIDVFKRLRVPQLAEYLGVKHVNFNKAESSAVSLWEDKLAYIAKTVVDSEYFINIPKLKTHLLAQISAALKSLVGCFVGLQKRRMHDHIIENIILVNELFPPDLTFVDALVAMEGQGPGIGTPVVLDRILCGKNPYTLDLACAVLSGHDPAELKLMQMALEKGHLTPFEVEEALDSIPCVYRFKPAVPNKVVRVVSNPVLNRLRELVRPLFLLPIVHEILYRLDIREDHLDYDDGDARVELASESSESDRVRCTKYCPISVDIEGFRWPEDAQDKCLQCFCCAFLCADDGVRVVGKLGYLDYLLEHYRPWTTKLN